MVRLLIVEDEYIVAKALQVSLTRYGYDVLEPVGDAQSAIETARRHQPDFVLMDVHLAGDADGLEAAAAIIAEMQIPIIVMSGFSDADMVARASDINALAYLVKPITPDKVRAAIEEASATDSR